MCKQDIEDIQQILYWFYGVVNSKEIEPPDIDNARILELKRKLNKVDLVEPGSEYVRDFIFS